MSFVECHFEENAYESPEYHTEEQPYDEQDQEHYVIEPHDGKYN